MSTVITVENLGKKYTISHQQREEYSSLRDVITNSVASLGKKLIQPFRRSLATCPLPHDPASEDFWALKDVSFEVKQGERIGIIGRNGAGKSTLLKILSRITEPTTGSIRIKGKVASLLEVGTGFHPELSGRENIFLNGAILGMDRVEIKKKFDEIVDFAEIEKFLDTPVKRYSSGMYVRLAFAVAAHLEPEILIIDEVLSVGDAQFQNKCLGKMEDVSAKEGRTVLFVSHQMGAIAQLCNNAILLNSGSVLMSGNTERVIETYLGNSASAGKNGFKAPDNCDKDIFIAEAHALNSSGEITSGFSHQDEIILSFSLKINKWVSDFNVGFFVRDIRGRRVFTAENRNWDKISHIEQEVCISVRIPSNFLVPGHYMFTFFASVPTIRFIDWVDDALAVTIIDTGSKFLMYEGGDYGCVFAECKWDVINT